MAAWSAIRPGLSMAVNLSARQFGDQWLIQDVADILERSGLGARQLELELTESLLMQAAEAAETLQRLKALGVRISVDDFGTGWTPPTGRDDHPTAGCPGCDGEVAAGDAWVEQTARWRDPAGGSQNIKAWLAVAGVGVVGRPPVLPAPVGRHLVVRDGRLGVWRLGFRRGLVRRGLI